MNTLRGAVCLPATPLFTPDPRLLLDTHKPPGKAAILVPTTSPLQEPGPPWSRQLLDGSSRLPAPSLRCGDPPSSPHSSKQRVFTSARSPAPHRHPRARAGSGRVGSASGQGPLQHGGNLWWTGGPPAGVLIDPPKDLPVSEIFCQSARKSVPGAEGGENERKAACTERSLMPGTVTRASPWPTGLTGGPGGSFTTGPGTRPNPHSRALEAPHQQAGFLLPPGASPSPVHAGTQPTGKFPNHLTPVETCSPPTPSANPHGTCGFPSPGVVEPELPVGFVSQLVTEEASHPSQDKPGGATPGTERGHSPL